MRSDQQADYIVVGAGSSGSVVASAPISRCIVGEHRLGKGVESDEEWRTYIRAAA